MTAFRRIGKCKYVAVKEDKPLFKKFKVTIAMRKKLLAAFTKYKRKHNCSTPIAIIKILNTFFKLEEKDEV